MPNALSASEMTDLYCALAGPLERLVRGSVRASDAVVEDACQSAWSRLVDHCARVRRDTALGWLAKTALREAFRLSRCERREQSLPDLLTAAGSASTGPPTLPVDELVYQRARLEQIGQLPARQQRLVWLHGLGLSYAEMALHTGDSARTVERQLLRAKRALRQLDAE
ncbi:MAG: sigma-70 family RNA polymerase sigma factor [Solirubrobacterales bacterium]|nr:sigma-70 family RNA polymerase sigma factor [Solirubrobacterales bacterium]